MIDLSVLPMRLAMGQVSELTDEWLQFAKQCGCDDVQMNYPNVPGDERWEYEDLLALRKKANDAGLRLMAFENVPTAFYDKIMLGLPGREKQIENMKQTIRNMGKAGVPILGYHFMPNGVWRTSFHNTIRGDAISNEFRLSEAKTEFTHGRRYTADEMWENYDWYLSQLLPVCEEENVRLALHPDDPPGPELGGIARLFGDFEGHKRAMEVHNSPMHGLDFCYGTWSEMLGKNVLDAIRYFGPKGRILFVHMRDVLGTPDDFHEVFLGDGNTSIFEGIKTLKESGFRGHITNDHVPAMAGDTPWGHRSRAWANGYIAAMIDAVNYPDPR
jgi:mannonate dehydratase